MTEGAQVAGELMSIIGRLSTHIRQELAMLEKSDRFRDEGHTLINGFMMSTPDPDHSIRE